jgi:membrane protein YqaA with SNARE-associated domain
MRTLAHPFARWIIATFVSPLGIVVLAALDSTLFFSLPFGLDAAVVLLSARLGRGAWVVPLLASAGSIAGALLTFWMGTAMGDKGLERFVSANRLERIRRQIRARGAIALAAMDLVPPPFPFTLFVLAAGALDVGRGTFFGTLATCRLLRFGLEALLAVVYGRRILGWLDTDLFHEIVVGSVILASLLTALSLVGLVRSTRPRRQRAAA